MQKIHVETKRLLLREIDLLDAQDINEYASDIEVTKFTVWGPDSIEETKMFIKEVVKNQRIESRTDYDFGIVLKESNKLIGTGSIIVDDLNNKEGSMGYCINKKFWGEGYGTELLEGMKKLSFKLLKLHRIYALVDPENIASIRVLEKSGMIREGLLREHRFQKGKWRSSILYSMLEQEYVDR